MDGIIPNQVYYIIGTNTTHIVSDEKIGFFEFSSNVRFKPIVYSRCFNAADLSQVNKQSDI